MKRILTAATVCTLLLCLLLLTTACSFYHPLEEFYKRVEEQGDENYKLTVTYYVSGFGRVTQTCFIDGNVAYYPPNTILGTDEYYVEITEDGVNQYTVSPYGGWRKSVIDEDLLDYMESMQAGLNNDLFNPDYYEQSDDDETVYTQKKSAIFDNFEDVKITFYEDTVIIECMMSFGTTSVQAKIVLSEIGEQSLQAPNA